MSSIHKSQESIRGAPSTNQHRVKNICFTMKVTKCASAFHKKINNCPYINGVKTRVMQYPKMRFVALILVVFVAFAVREEAKASEKDWWKHAVFYQIYPRSFKDNTNDGIGDLLGIIEKLPYLAKTGVTAIWLSPIFQSPQVDQGYDISNYTNIDPDYGTIADLKTLIHLAHTMNLRVILDFVPNHTSDKHKWFIDSENRVEEFEDFYVWSDGKVDEDGNRIPPNNWISAFKNSSWAWSEKRQEYYLHQFAAAQPDLNYRNPEVVTTMQNVMRYWMDQGIDGFRIDAVPFLVEDAELRDEVSSGAPGYISTDYEYLIHNLTVNLQETYDVVYGWREVVDNYTNEHDVNQKVIMTEAYADQAQTMLYYGTPDGSRLGAHFTFNFNLITLVKINSKATDIANAINQWINAIPDIYTSNWVLGNHDNHRVASRFGPKNIDGFNMLMAMLPGVGITYNGEEFGQEDGEVSFAEGQDPSARDPAIFDKVSRDFERTPLQWDTSVNAGFNEGAKPWLPVSKKYLETNEAAQDDLEIKSHYNIYRSLIALRRFDELLNGTTQVEALTDGVLVVKRALDKSRAVLLFNVGDSEQTVDASDYLTENNFVVVSSVESQFNTTDFITATTLNLLPHESVIFLSSLS